MKKYFENPHSFHINTKGHTLALCPFASKEEALSPQGEYAKQVTPLMKNWAHYTFEGVDAIPSELFSANIPLDSYQTVSLPYSLETENQADAFPFLIDPPYGPASMEVQVFAKNINLIQPDDGQQRILSVQGCFNGLYVYCNGSLVGYHGQPGVGTSFDCTPYLQQGSNRLVLVVLSYTAANYMIPTARVGLVGEVAFITRKSGGVQTLSLSYDLPIHYKTATIHAQVDALCPEEITLCLYAPNGELLEQKNSGADGCVEFTVHSPELWSHEIPNLYTLLACFQGEVTCHKIGLRNTVFHNKQFTVNGRRVPLQGVIYPCVLFTKEQMEQDLCQMKKQHINTLWIPEFPQKELLDLCDEYGFYLLVNSGIDTPYVVRCSHNFIANDLSFRDMMMHRMEALVYQSAHPCVIARCVGKPYGVGSNIKFALDTLRQLDPKTPAFAVDNSGLSDSDLVIATKDFSPTENKPCIFMGETCSRENAVGHIVGYYNQSSLPKEFCPIGVTLIDGATGELQLTNGNAFTYFSKFRCDYQITRYGQVVEQGVGGIFSLPPATTEKVQLHYHLPSEGECALQLRFTYLGDTPYAKSGELAGTFQFPLPVSARRNNTPVQGMLPELIEKENQLHIYAADCHYTLSTTLGQLIGIEYKEQQLLCAPPPASLTTGCRGVSYTIEENCIVVTAVLKVGHQGFTPLATLTKRWTFYPDGAVTVEPSLSPAETCFQGHFALEDSLKTLTYYGAQEEIQGLYTLALSQESLETTKGKLFRFENTKGLGLALFNAQKPFALSAKQTQEKEIVVSFTPPVSFTLKPMNLEEDPWQIYNNTYEPMMELD